MLEDQPVREPNGGERTSQDVDIPEVEPQSSLDRSDWARACAGDGQAFARIFDRHRDRVFRHSLRLVPNPADVDDAVAITFLEAWRCRHRARLVEGSLLPWLLVTATHVTRNQSRSARRHALLLARLPTVENAADHADLHDDGPASAALRSLSLADRHVITLCVLEGLTDREAATVLGVAVGTVKSRLSRAKRRLASQLDPDRLEPHRPARLTEARNDG